MDLDEDVDVALLDEFEKIHRKDPLAPWSHLRPLHLWPQDLIELFAKESSSAGSS